MVIEPPSGRWEPALLAVSKTTSIHPLPLLGEFNAEISRFSGNKLVPGTTTGFLPHPPIFLREPSVWEREMERGRDQGLVDVLDRFQKLDHMAHCSSVKIFLNCFFRAV